MAKRAKPAAGKSVEALRHQEAKRRNIPRAEYRRWSLPPSMEATTKRPRISLDVAPELRRRLRLAAAKRDLTVQRYVLDAVEERLREDLGDEDRATVLTATSDPVLARLWENDKDAAYDALSAR